MLGLRIHRVIDFVVKTDVKNTLKEKNKTTMI